MIIKKACTLPYFFLQQHVISLFLLAVITPLIYIKLLADGTDLPRYTLISFFAFTSTTLFILKLYKKPTVFINKAFLLLAIVFIWSAVSLLWSPDIGNSYIEIQFFFSSLLILFLAMQIKFHKQKSFIINGAIAGCLLVSIIGLLQAFNFNPFNIHYRSLPASTFINKNHASIYIEFFVPILLLFILYTNKQSSKIVYSFILTLALSFLFILSSFGSLISILLAISLSAFILSKHTNIFFILKKNQIYLLAVLLGTIIVTSVSAYSLSLGERRSLTEISEKKSHTQRLAVYTKSFDAIKSSPFTGFGYGAFRAGIIPYISEVQSISKHDENIYFSQTHNDFLQQFTETGIISGFLFIIFFTRILYLGLNSLPNKKISEKNIFTFSISSGLFVLILHSFIDFPFHLATSNFLIYLTSGLILASTNKNIIFKKNIYFNLSTSFIFILLTAFLIFSTYFNIKHISSSKLLRDAVIALRVEKNCNKAVKLIDKSNHIFKFDFPAQVTQAQIYGVCPQTRNKQRQVIEQLVHLNPVNFKARYLHANNFLAENNSMLAFNNYYYIVKMLPNSALGYIGISKWAVKLNKYKDARIYIEKAKKLDTNSLEIELLLKKINAESS